MSCPWDLTPTPRFIPGVFKLATDAVPRREVAELLHQLLTLPQAGEQPWNLDVRATKPEPLAVGTKFALQVTTSHDGFSGHRDGRNQRPCSGSVPQSLPHAE